MSRASALHIHAAAQAFEGKSATESVWGTVHHACGCACVLQQRRNPESVSRAPVRSLPKYRPSISHAYSVPRAFGRSKSRAVVIFPLQNISNHDKVVAA